MSHGPGDLDRDTAPAGRLPEAVEPPPPLGSWPRVYAAVIAGLALMIALCGWLSRLGR